MTREQRADEMMRAWLDFQRARPGMLLDEILWPLVREAWLDGWDRGRTVGVQDGIDMGSMAVPVTATRD